MKRCPACDTENEDFFSFCLGCGHDLDGGAVDVTPTPSSAAAEPASDEAPAAAAEEVASPKDESAPPGEASVIEDAPAEGADVEAFELADVDGVGFESPAAAEVTPVETSDLGEASAEGEGVTGADAVCPACDGSVDADATFCVMCGTEIAPVRAASTRRVVQEAPRKEGTTHGALHLVEEDGSLGERYPLYADQTLLGRDGGHINFPDDDFMSSRHAEFKWCDGVLSVEPLETTNGIFLRIAEEMELTSGACFRIGQELLRFDGIDDLPDSLTADDDETRGLGSPLGTDTWGRLIQLVAEDTAGRAFMLAGDEVTLGRDRGDITFGGDGYVSGAHARLTHRDGRFFLTDLDSSNGTYLRVRSAVSLSDGDHILAGQQLFKFEV